MPLAATRFTRAALLAALVSLASGQGYAAVISAAGQTAVPGQTVIASVLFAAEGQQVSGIQFDLAWDTNVDVKVTTGDSLRSSSKLLYATGLDLHTARCLVVGTNSDSVSDGEVLKLFVVVGASALPGIAQVRFTNVSATDASGNSVMLRFSAVNVDIQRASGSTKQPNSNWSTPFTQVALPAAITKTVYGIRGATILPDGYAYVGSAAGVYRAATNCLAAGASNVGCWSAINNGIPAAFQGADPYLAAVCFDYVGGKVLAGMLDPLTGRQGRVCTWDPAIPVWACNKPQTPDPFAVGTAAITHDVNNNLYAGAFSIYKSTDGGLTWIDQTRGDAYGSTGHNTGFLFDIKVWGGNIYWGGEGPLIKQPLNFLSFQSLLPTANGGCADPNCYAHNMRGTMADGNAAVGAQSEVIALINHCNGGLACTTQSGYVQRLNVATNIWSPAGDANVPGAGTSAFWTIRRLAQGYTAHEYYAVGGGNQTGVLGTLDGGATWTLLGNGQTLNSPTNDGAFSLIGVSPIDDSKIAARQADLWFHPGPGPTDVPSVPTVPPNSVVNAASLLASPVAPGEIVTFFGSVPSAPTFVVNGTPAPLLYAGSNQINAIMPFGLDVSTPVDLQVQSNGQTVAKGTLPVARVAPAVFTQNGSGSGPGAVLNQDFTLNSESNPAAPGSAIMVYGTGFGVVNPPTADGQPAGGTASTVLPVTASIGGVAAQVLYAGAAPGLVAGVVQINVVVPPGLHTNAATPISLSVGSAFTQTGVTIAVR